MKNENWKRILKKDIFWEWRIFLVKSFKKAWFFWRFWREMKKKSDKMKDFWEIQPDFFASGQKWKMGTEKEERILKNFRGIFFLLFCRPSWWLKKLKKDYYETGCSGIGKVPPFICISRRCLSIPLHGCRGCGELVTETVPLIRQLPLRLLRGFQVNLSCGQLWLQPLTHGCGWQFYPVWGLKIFLARPKKFRDQWCFDDLSSMDPYAEVINTYIRVMEVRVYFTL